MQGSKQRNQEKFKLGVLSYIDTDMFSSTDKIMFRL